MSVGVRAICIQLSVLSRPLLGPSGDEQLDTRREWYQRIAAELGWNVESWVYNADVRGPIAFSEARGVLEQLKVIVTKAASVSYDALFLDLSSYDFRYQDWDSLRDAWKSALQKYARVVIIFSDSAPVTDSKALNDLYLARKNQPGQLEIFDSRGTRYDLEKSGDARRRNYPHLRRFLVNLDSQSFRTSTLALSRRYFGHFVTPSGSHIRTHYDLAPIVRNARTYEYIRSRAKQIKDNDGFDLIVGFGLGTGGLVQLCDYLGRDLDVPSVFYDRHGSQDIEKHIISGHHKVLLVSDVVLTGQTAEQRIDKLSNHNGQVSHILVVIGLLGSPDTIKGIPVSYCTTLNRQFFPKSEPCPLCAISGIAPQTTESANDFVSSLRRHITDYDYWELVKESKALRIGHQKSGNGRDHYIVRIDTVRLLERYGDFVASILAERIKAELGEDPVDIIACPVEKNPPSHKSGGIYLAYEIAKALELSSRNVIGVARDDLERCSPTAADDEIADRYATQIKKAVNWTKGREARVLAVDDGVNSGHTLHNMVSLLRTAKLNVRGYAVFLNAFSDKGKSIQKTIGSAFYHFYKWELGPFPERRCPMCRTVLKQGSPLSVE